LATRTLYTPVASEVLTAANLKKLAGGWIGYASEASPPTVTTSETDIISITVTVPANRLIRVSGSGSVIDGDNNSAGGIVFVEEGSTDMGRIHRHPDAAEQSFVGGYVLIDNPSAGSHTYKLVGQTTAGDFTFFGSVYILVEDIGPNS
jgi:hypothetical protein